MRKIQMVDLVSQYQKIQRKVDEKIIQIVRSSQYIKGPEVRSFEQELAAYLNVKHVVACANGTDALQLSLMALDLQPGDEVITSNFTYVATAEVIALLRLKPILVDADPKTFNIDVNQVADAIGPKTKAIVPVHLFGQCADMESLLSLAREKEIAVVEDTAQAIGSVYSFADGSRKMAGTMGNIGTTSFFPSKNLGCMGDGGAMYTDDDALAEKLRMIANHGQTKLYYHDFVGCNSRLDAIQAGILRVKLQYLEDYIEARQQAADCYDHLFSDIEEVSTPFRSDRSTHVFHQYVVQLQEGIDRNQLREYLTENEIPSNIYYPLPLHKQKAYQHSGMGRRFPVTESLCKNVLALPMHTELDKEQQEYIVQTIKTFIGR